MDSWKSCDGFHFLKCMLALKCNSPFCYLLLLLHHSLSFSIYYSLSNSVFLHLMSLYSRCKRSPVPTTECIFELPHLTVQATRAQTLLLQAICQSWTHSMVNGSPVTLSEGLLREVCRGPGNSMLYSRHCLLFHSILWSYSCISLLCWSLTSSSVRLLKPYWDRATGLVMIVSYMYLCVFWWVQWTLTLKWNNILLLLGFYPRDMVLMCRGRKQVYHRRAKDDLHCMLFSEIASLCLYPSCTCGCRFVIYIPQWQISHFA